MTRHGLAGVMICAGLALATSSARADDTKTKSDDTTTTAKKPTNASKAKAKKAREEEAKEAQKKVDEGKVKEANDAADAAAAKANTDVVGKKTQKENEVSAESARPKPDNDKEAHDAAKAIGKATTTAADWFAVGIEDSTHATDKPGKYVPFAMEWSPLGLIDGGRVSFNLEWAPVTHNAIVVSPHIIHTTADIATDSNTTSSQAFTGFGGELGYRYYTGRRGMNGVFLGPSLIAGVYNAGLPNGDQAFTDFGVAADIGLQTIVWNHVVLGGGVGVEYLHVSHDFHDLPAAPSQIASTGVKPRLLFEVGYGF